ncbi:porin [Flexithrix dorotheae]|uniref:porin n=1 Tax=Flexithrix dorotheae TaxID=70993 RepID=UPI00038172BF|nr:porin [Flexithrix dorotheae]
MQRQIPDFYSKIIVFLLLNFFCVNPLSAQVKGYGNKPLKVNLNESGSHYLKFSASGQVWLRTTQNNPGSMVFGEPQDITTDFSIRRYRLGVSGKITDKIYFFTSLGKNNINYLSQTGISADVLDILGEYEFNKAFAIGAGKVSWTGFSRYSAPSTSKVLGVDVPLFAMATINQTDDLLRKLSIYTKGQVGKFDYRLIASKPFAAQSKSGYDPTIKENIATFSDLAPRIQTSGYFKWHFWDIESNQSPYMSFTEHGKKKLLILGAGFEFQPKALWHLNAGDTVLNMLKLFAIDLFMETPVNKSGDDAITIYAGLFHFDFGPNYIRNIGANNPANGVDPTKASFNGAGNAFPMIGTGNIFHGQLGYLIPNRLLWEKGPTFQPYFTVQLADYQRLNDPLAVYDMGINMLLYGHLAKVTFGYQNRPIFSNNDIQVIDRKSMYVLQIQIRIE